MSTTSSANTVWSSQQDVIFSEIVDGNSDVVVRARAGTGKTTTIVEAIKRLLRAHPELAVLLCAFNKRIAEELNARFAGITGVTVKTLHAIGLACVKRFWPDVRIDFGSGRADDLAERVCGAVAPDAIKKLVAKLCTKGREIAPHAREMGALTDIAITFECEPEESWAEDGFDLSYVEMKALAAMELAANEKPIKTGIDGADMIFLPVRNGWLRKWADIVIVDEAQDMTTAQLEIAQGSCKGRIVVVGDDRQAIYAFRGADSNSLDRLKTELKAVEFPLTVTYRCGRVIVERAAQLVPDFEASPSNPEGSIEVVSGEKLTEMAGPGDFILSRINAPLVSIAMSLLRSGKRARVAGRDIGKGLTTLIRKMRARSIPELLTKITAWEKKELARLDARFKNHTDSPTYAARIDGVKDQADMLASLAEGAPSVAEVERRIEALFTDDGLGQAGVITLSSVHKAKGLEATRVFVLQKTLRSDTQEELNIAYVAITRAKSSLVWVL